MIFPVGDTPNPPGIPLMTYLLIGVNVAVYLLVTLPFSAMDPDLADPLLLEYLRSLGAYGAVSAAEIREYLSAYDLIVYRFGFRPADFSFVSLFTSLFLHGGFWHLAGNMLFLWIFGDNVEHRVGRPLFLAGYLFCGVCATLFFSFFALDSQIPLVGASGAISGILGCYFLWFPKNRVRCFLFLFPFLMTTIMIPARIVLGFYLLIDNLLPFLVNGSGGGGVAYGAHIGGFVAGAGLAFTADRASGWGRRGKVNIDRGETVCSPQAIGAAVTRGDMASAASCFLGLKSREQRESVAAEDILLMGEHLLSQGNHYPALKVFRRFISEHQNDPQLARAYLGAGHALASQPRYVTSAYHYFLAAIDLANNSEIADEARQQLRLIEQIDRTGDLPPVR